MSRLTELTPAYMTVHLGKQGVAWVRWGDNWTHVYNLYLYMSYELHEQLVRGWK